MPAFAMLLKSYGHDEEYARRLIDSFHRFNVQGIRLFVVVPEEDLSAFSTLEGPTVIVLSEGLLAQHLVDEPLQGIQPGYLNQEIVKLAFWELGLAENYFCVDSDAVFIRPFTPDDFMRDEHTPYTVLVEDNDLKVEPRYYREYWQGREAALLRIRDLVELDDPVIRTCHGHQIFSSAVLRAFAEKFLAPRGWTYLDALAEAPYEFSWYNLWLQKDQTIPIHAREPLVKVFHNEGQHLEYIVRGVSVSDIARGYVALVINSNYSRDMGLISAHATKPDLLSHYLSYRELGQVLSGKIRDTLHRRFSSSSQ